MTRSVPPEPAARLASAVPAQTSLARLRFLGYFGVQVNALLVPLVVFQLTGSANLAGAALFIEWFPKLGLYFVSGSVVQRFGSAACHLGLELARVAALVGISLSTLGLGSVWVVSISAALYQCANAISNTIFERSVTHWWPTDSRAQGHALMLKRDQWGCLAALLCGLTLRDPQYLALLTLGVQALSSLAVVQLRRMVHPTSDSQGAARQGLRQQLLTDFRAANQAVLWKLCGLAVLLSTPVALVFSALVFLLERAQPGIAGTTTWLSGLLLARTVASLVAMTWVQRQLRQPNREKAMATGGLAMLLMGCFALAPTEPVMPVCAAVILVGVAGYLYLPWLRTLRQELIAVHVPQNSRSGATGILIGVEAGAYLVAAGLLSALGGHLGLLMGAAASMVATALWLLCRRRD